MEVWKDIEGYEGLYRVSNLGNILSLNYKHRGYPKQLTPKINNKGYAWVELRKNKTPKQISVHRLVAMAFLDNPDNLPEVNHKDENPLNNRLDNLEWCSRIHNIRYSLQLHPSRMAKPKPPKSRVNHKWNERVRQMDTEGKIIREYIHLGEVKHALKKNEYGVRECCLGKRKTAYGYRWEFCK